MKLLTQTIREKLLKNGRLQMDRTAHGLDPLDLVPVVKLFTPDAACTWLLTELDPLEPDIAFGLCDLGLGSPEIGSVSIAEISALRGRLGLPVERDRYFEAEKPISVYAALARDHGYIPA